eukprot:6063041-Karenia_brevis.AAC.1
MAASQKVTNNIVESCRAASLVCHSASGVVANARKAVKSGCPLAVRLAEASRLLRSAEGLCR